MSGPAPNGDFSHLLHLGHLAFEKTIVDYRQTGSSSLPRDSILKNQRDANGLPSKASAGTAEMLMLLLV